MDLGTVPLKRLACGICCHLMPLRKDGAIRVYGPVNHHRPGSGRVLSVDSHGPARGLPSRGLDVIMPLSCSRSMSHHFILFIF